MKKSKYFVLPLLCAFALGLTGCTEMIKKVTMAAIEQVTDHEYKDSEKLGKVVTQTLDAADVSYTFPYAPEICRKRATKVVDTIVDALKDSMM